MWQVAIVIVVVLIICELLAVPLTEMRQSFFNLAPIPPYIIELAGLPIAILAGYFFYLRIKKVAPAESDKVSVYNDHIEIQQHGNSRSITFENITNVTAITNKYGIIFLEVNVGTETIKIVGINDLKGLFSALTKRLPSSKVNQKNFLQAMGKIR